MTETLTAAVNEPMPLADVNTEANQLAPSLLAALSPMLEGG